MSKLQRKSRTSRSQASRLLTHANTSHQEEVEWTGGALSLYSGRAAQLGGDNQDSVGAFLLGRNRAVLIVADGLGGLPQGDAASRLAVETVRKSIRKMKGSAPLRSFILDGIETANQKLVGKSGATTLALLELGGQFARPYHVGDSAIFHFSASGKLKWQSVSHSPVGYAMASGILDEASAIRHLDRHLVSNIVGSADMRIDIGPKLALAKGDYCLLASDGLTDNLYIEEIGSLLRNKPAAEAVKELSTLAHERMESPKAGKPSKPDDCSFILYQRV